MSFTLQQQIRNNSTDIKSYIDDLYKWEDSVTASKLKTKPKPASELPPVRGIVNEPAPDPNSKLKRDGNTVSDYYKAWDKFDPDKELKKLDDEGDSPQFKPPQMPLNPDLKTRPAVPANVKLVVKGGRNPNSEFEALKDKGNLYFRSHEYQKALDVYSEAIEKLNYSNTKDQLLYATLLSNRAMTYIRLQEFAKAESDCEKAIECQPGFNKAYARRALCRKKMGKIKPALADFRKALELDRENSEFISEIRVLEEVLKSRREKLRKGMILAFKDHDKKWATVGVVDVGGGEVKRDPFKEMAFTVEEQPVIGEKQGIKENAENGPKSKGNEPNSTIEDKNKGLSYDFTRLKQIDRVSRVKNAKKEGDFNEIERKRVVFGGEHEMEEIPLKKHVVDRKKHPGIGILKQRKSQEKPDKTAKIGLENVIEQGKKQAIAEILKESSENKLVAMNSARFFGIWKNISKDPLAGFQFLQSFPTSDLPQIFKDSIEISLILEIISIFQQNILVSTAPFIAEFLTRLTSINRFNIAVSFALSSEKAAISKLITNLHDLDHLSPTQYSQLMELYKLKK